MAYVMWYQITARNTARLERLVSSSTACGRWRLGAIGQIEWNSPAKTAQGAKWSQNGGGNRRTNPQVRIINT